jgi:hypothetical protein
METNKITPERLAEIEARVNAATPGPWVHDEFWGVVDPVFVDEDGHLAPQDMKFIAAAREDVPDLIARVRELEAEITRLREVYRRALKFRGEEAHADPDGSVYRHAHNS